ncbi:MAG: hypothetical protein MK066_14680 [Crocinitomicaceae bacterium]|nr:hypothetical protein [Crocinitomicaceae bacterium]
MKEGKGLFNWDFLGEVASAIPEVTGQMNKNYLNSQVQIANAQARAAEAAARNQNNNNPMVMNEIYLWIIGIVGLLVIAYFIFKPSQNG